MAKIIFGYECSAVLLQRHVIEEFSFKIYEKGTVRYKKNTIGRNFSESKVIESKKIILPKSIVEDLKKILHEEKILIEQLPDEINNHSLDGAYHDFNFLDKKISCLNIGRHDLDEISEPKIFIGEVSCFIPQSEKITMQQENSVLRIFESVYEILKDYGLKVYSWEYFYCEWEME